MVNVLGREYSDVWVTSDLHFGHKNVIKFCPATRPYKDAEEMNEAIISDWNSKVKDNDLVIIVGDFSFMNLENTLSILRRLNGKKILVIGNHDQKLMQSHTFRNEFILCKDLLSINIDSQKYIFCHYPIFEWESMQRGSMHLHGHVHGNPTEIEGRILDSGWDAQGKIININSAKEFLLNKPIRSH
jgi:calcineurin-like phosphoesterase family protein